MKHVARNWFVAPWSPPRGGTPEIKVKTLKALQEGISQVPEDSQALVPVRILRKLVNFALDSFDRGTLGALIEDLDTQTRYRATIGRGDGKVWLRTLEVQRTDGGKVDREAMRRVPVQQIAEAVAQSLEENLDPDTIVIRNGDVRLPSDVGDMPSSEEIATLMRAGHTRRTLAARYSREVSTIDDWIGRARGDVPDLMPPRPPGGRPRKTTPVSGDDGHNNQREAEE